MATDRHQAPSYPLRMPEDLKAKVAEAAEASGRSLHAELLARLQASFDKEVATRNNESAMIHEMRITQALLELNGIQADFREAIRDHREMRERSRALFRDGADAAVLEEFEKQYEESERRVHALQLAEREAANKINLLKREGDSSRMRRQSYTMTKASEVLSEQHRLIEGGGEYIDKAIELIDRRGTESAAPLTWQVPVTAKPKSSHKPKPK